MRFELRAEEDRNWWKQTWTVCSIQALGEGLVTGREHCEEKPSGKGCQSGWGQHVKLHLEFSALCLRFSQKGSGLPDELKIREIVGLAWVWNRLELKQAFELRFASLGSVTKLGIYKWSACGSFRLWNLLPFRRHCFYFIYLFLLENGWLTQKKV